MEQGLTRRTVLTGAAALLVAPARAQDGFRVCAPPTRFRARCWSETREEVRAADQ
jgi:hypothetical protein